MIFSGRFVVLEGVLAPPRARRAHAVHAVYFYDEV
jgi:hypothetical protein